MHIVKHRKIWFAISGALIALSIFGMFSYGFNLSIDFKGGTLTEVRYTESRPPLGDVESSLRELNIGNVSVRPSEHDRYIIRSRELNQEESGLLVERLGSPEVLRQNTIGPIAGAELAHKSLIAIAIVLVMIVLFVTFAFRKVSKPVASWKYGLATIVALFHDIIIPTGVFVFLGKLYGLEIDLLFASGLLAILGYSVHDTIVVFDRVRENLRVNQEKNINEPFETTVGNSLVQTMARSINTSFTLLITLAALYIFGSTATRDFSLLLIIGVIVGVYSSIFVASPLLVTLHKIGRK
ncbi:MAG: protein translocase subunit SecF [bacterium]|nr:protein translocase subunit SecF [bacterium]